MTSSPLLFLIRPQHYSNAGVFQCRPYQALEAQHYPLNNLHLPLQNNGAALLLSPDASTIGHFGTLTSKTA